MASIVRYAALVVAAMAALGVIASGAARQQIRYSPDSVLDANPTVAYVEPAIVSDPARAQTLVAAAESADFSFPPQAFVSDDGGYDWRPSPLLMGHATLTGDVQLAAGPERTIYFAALGPRNHKSVIHLFASTNHGNWFNHVAFIENHVGYGSFDHEQLAIDDSRSPYRGDIYFSAIYILRLQPQLNACGLMRSSNGGKHFLGPVQVIDGWCLNSRPVTLSDGALIFPFIMAGKPGASGVPPGTGNNVEVAISRNGGKTFTRPQVIGTYIADVREVFRRIAEGRTDFDLDPVPQFATGKSPVTHREVIYGVWSDLRTGNSRLLFTTSTDEGLHWSTPTPILTTANPNDAQYQVSPAVNSSGTLGIAYLQYSSATGNVTEMFADSTDGGVTFSKPVPLQSQPAQLALSARSGFSPLSGSHLIGSNLKGRIAIDFIQPVRRFTSGGDYVQTAVDGNGVFHPVWVDARTGRDQVWTASAGVGAALNGSAQLLPADVTGDIDLLFGAGTWDEGSHTLSVAVRLHNGGKRPLYPPFKVTVLRLHNPLWPAKWYSKIVPSLLNADNGQQGVGAVYTYGPQMLGNLGMLAPGADTAPRIWKVRLMTNGDNQPSIIVRVDGYQSR